MCRSIKPLREGVRIVDDTEVRAAALQFVRKVSGFPAPSPANRPAFDAAVEDVAAACHRLLGSLTVGGRPTVPPR